MSNAKLKHAAGQQSDAILKNTSRTACPSLLVGLRLFLSSLFANKRDKATHSENAGIVGIFVRRQLRHAEGSWLRYWDSCCPVVYACARVAGVSGVA
jgi:hypothetical protein